MKIRAPCTATKGGPGNRINGARELQALSGERPLSGRCEPLFASNQSGRRDLNPDPLNLIKVPRMSPYRIRSYTLLIHEEGQHQSHNNILQ